MKVINENELKWSQVSDTLKIKYLLENYFCTSNYVTSGVANWPKGKAGEPHTHPEHDEIYIVLRGRGRANMMGKIIEVGPGDMMHAQAGDVHGMLEGITDEGIDLFFVLIPKEKE